ncbi:hypothetical protein EVAR_28458_1 [Eumeta japonica]|uniref:Uncharacterized protein n=1 Tax=Eumeta variegata TaxID=151549 RepID=A0A4C1V837_EUMVA|nr:hypothetical protein EVAR_28458_1 [Eumeta japonica]
MTTAISFTTDVGRRRVTAGTATLAPLSHGRRGGGRQLARTNSALDGAIGIYLCSILSRHGCEPTPRRYRPIELSVCRATPATIELYNALCNALGLRALLLRVSCIRGQTYMTTSREEVITAIRGQMQLHGKSLVCLDLLAERCERRGRTPQEPPSASFMRRYSRIKHYAMNIAVKQKARRAPDQYLTGVIWLPLSPELSRGRRQLNLTGSGLTKNEPEEDIWKEMDDVSHLNILLDDPIYERNSALSYMKLTFSYNATVEAAAER